MNFKYTKRMIDSKMYVLSRERYRLRSKF